MFVSISKVKQQITITQISVTDAFSTDLKRRIITSRVVSLCAVARCFRKLIKLLVNIRDRK